MATLVVTNYTKFATKIKRFSVDNVKITGDLEVLKNEVAEKLQTSPSSIELIYCGRCLKSGRTLESQSIRPGVTIHALNKITGNSEGPAPGSTKLGPTEIQQLVLALRTAVMNSAYRETVQRLSKPEVLENIIAATPGLADDPVAIAILQDPDMLVNLTDVNSINRVIQSHPALAEAVNQIAAAVHEGGASSSGGHAQQMLASAYLYSMDAMSDDDDDGESSQIDQGSTSSGNSFQHLSFSGITQAQLASALASVGGRGSSMPDVVSPSGAQQSGDQEARGSVITPELFGEAVQQALGSSTQAQLQQLRDMGISNDALSLRALEATGGDVHAALELIFGDFIDSGVNSSQSSGN